MLCLQASAAPARAVGALYPQPRRCWPPVQCPPVGVLHGDVNAALSCAVPPGGGDGTEDPSADPGAALVRAVRRREGVQPVRRGEALRLCRNCERLGGTLPAPQPRGVPLLQGSSTAGREEGWGGHTSAPSDLEKSKLLPPAPSLSEGGVGKEP